MYKVVLVRHGESEWNKENRFTGWTDVDLSDQGVREAKEAGKILKESGFVFDRAYTSVLKRANKTLNIILEEMDELWIPTEKTWKLNERHYGALQGLDKSETVKKYGEEQVLHWRRSYNITPPELTKDDPRYPGKDPRYASLSESEIPLTESLQKTVERVIPYWKETIAPSIESGEKVIIAAHGNSLRALVMYLEHLSEAQVLELNLPTGTPLIYELDANLKPIRHTYLGDPSAIEAALLAVAHQGRAKV